MEGAIYLTNHATKVKLIHRRGELRAEKMLQERLLANPKIEMLWNSALEEVLGKHEGPMPEVTGMKVRDVITGKITEHRLDGIFIAIGHKPNTDIFINQLDMDEEGYLITKPDSSTTDIPGVFAAGDVQDKKFRQAVTAAGTGCMAALEAEKYIAEKENGSQAAAL